MELTSPSRRKSQICRAGMRERWHSRLYSTTTATPSVPCSLAETCRSYVPRLPNRPYQRPPCTTSPPGSRHCTDEAVTPCKRPATEIAQLEPAGTCTASSRNEQGPSTAIAGPEPTRTPMSSVAAAEGWSAQAMETWPLCDPFERPAGFARIVRRAGVSPEALATWIHPASAFAVHFFEPPPSTRTVIVWARGVFPDAATKSSFVRDRCGAPGCGPLPPPVPRSASIALATSIFLPAPVAPSRRAFFTCESVASGRADQSRAAAPATCGVAMLVPSYRAYWPGEVVDRIPTPGAVTIAPRFENEASEPSVSSAPTESTFARLRFAGKPGREAPSFPAAATNRTPCCAARATARWMTSLVPPPPQLALMTRAP